MTLVTVWPSGAVEIDDVLLVSEWTVLAAVIGGVAAVIGGVAAALADSEPEVATEETLVDPSEDAEEKSQLVRSCFMRMDIRRCLDYQNWLAVAPSQAPSHLACSEWLERGHVGIRSIS